MIDDPLKENRTWLQLLILPAVSLAATLAVYMWCTREENPFHCKEGVVQCGGNADSGVGEGGVDDVANHTLRAVDGRSPWEEDRDSAWVSGCCQILRLGGLICIVSHNTNIVLKCFWSSIKWKLTRYWYSYITNNSVTRKVNTLQSISISGLIDCPSGNRSNCPFW